MMAFRLSFFGGFFADGMMFLVELLTFGVIYSHVGSIGGWGRGQMLIFVGTFSILNALNMILFFFGIASIPGKIKSGDLDPYLTKPVSPLLRLTFENINPGSLPLLVFSVLIVRYGVQTAEIALTLPLVLAYAALVALMTVLYYDMELILRTVPFLVISANGIMKLEDHLLDLNFRIPGILFKGAFRALFYFVLPYGVMATAPALLLSGALTAAGLVHALGAVSFFTAFALWFWKFGLKRYKSAGG